LRKFLRYSWVQLALFCLASFILFLPILHKSFGGDDFSVLKRVALDRVIWIKDFFRPLSDITLFFNYLVGGFNPAGYYIFSIVIHGISSFLLFRLGLQWKWTEDKQVQKTYAFIAALLFLTYPFHSECIVWGLGRAAEMANLFGMAALVIAVSDLSFGRKIFFACLCYFIGLASYESIIFLPLMILIVLSGGATAREGAMRIRGTRIGTGLRQEGLSGRQAGWWILALGSTLIVHLAIRVLVAGGLMGRYGKGFFISGWKYHLENMFKVTGRLFLPPSDNTRLMMLLLGGVMAVLLLAVLFFLRRFRHEMAPKIYLLKLLLLLCIACIAPVVSGISTRTSEADRLLYFPSFFLSCGIALLLVGVVRNSNRLFLPVAFFIAYNMIQLEKGNRNWLRASDIARSVLNTVLRQDHSKKIFVVNVPDELDGAFIYRQGLPEAVMMRGLDARGLVVVNILKRDQERLLPDSIVSVPAGKELRIAPVVTIRRGGADSLRLSGVDESGTPFELGVGKKDAILYWDKKKLVKLEH
jgi:hypothetical protein